jgi:hypothetical protein
MEAVRRLGIIKKEPIEIIEVESFGGEIQDEN